MEQGTTTHNGKTPDTEFPLGFPEFIMLIATMMALNALSIDPMLPALPAMGKALGIIGENERQWIISSYFLGLGIGSLFYGSLSDRYGRNLVLLVTLALYLLSTLFFALAPSFPMTLGGRAAAGFFAAATQIGHESSRQRGCQSVLVSGVAVHLT